MRDRHSARRRIFDTPFLSAGRRWKMRSSLKRLTFGLCSSFMWFRPASIEHTGPSAVEYTGIASCSASHRVCRSWEPLARRLSAVSLPGRLGGLGGGPRSGGSQLGVPGPLKMRAKFGARGATLCEEADVGGPRTSPSRLLTKVRAHGAEIRRDPSLEGLLRKRFPRSLPPSHRAAPPRPLARAPGLR